MIEDIKAQLPVELSEAKRLVSARDEFIGNAKREAESIRRAAEEQARALVEEQEIVRIAPREEQRARRQCREQASEGAPPCRQRLRGRYPPPLGGEPVPAALSQVRGSRGQFRAAAGMQEQQPAQQK